MKTLSARASIRGIACLLLVWITALAGPTTAPVPLGLGERDQVVLLVGSALIHQEQFHGYLESFLVRRFPDKRTVCRNLGWSGDTVTGSARTKGYQNPAGFDRLTKQAAELKPDLIFVGYGSVESFDGPSGLDRFKDGYGKLLDAMAALTPRLVLLSPAFHEDLGKPLPDPEAHNKNLELYTQAIAEIARQRGFPFVDLFHPTVQAKAINPHTSFTDNGILLNDTGYWLVAQEIERQLDLSPPPCRIELGRDGKGTSAVGATLGEVNIAPDHLSFDVTLTLLPSPPAPDDSGVRGSSEPAPMLSVHGLTEGAWTLKIDGQDVLSVTSRDLTAGVGISRGPDIDQEAELRRLVVSRGGLFYRRWNPTNDIPQHYTYIAPDFAMYDAEVADLDKQIAVESRPVRHHYELVRKP